MVTFVIWVRERQVTAGILVFAVQPDISRILFSNLHIVVSKQTNWHSVLVNIIFRSQDGLQQFFSSWDSHHLSFTTTKNPLLNCRNSCALTLWTSYVHHWEGEGGSEGLLLLTISKTWGHLPIPTFELLHGAFLETPNNILWPRYLDTAGASTFSLSGAWARYLRRWPDVSSFFRADSALAFAIPCHTCLSFLNSYGTCQQKTMTLVRDDWREWPTALGQP